MTASDFLSSVEVLEDSAALAARIAFLDARVPTAGRVALGIGSDLTRSYPGYLFDYVQSRELVSESELMRRLGVYPVTYLMWDLAPDGGGSAVGRLVGVTAVLRGSPQELLAGVAWLPEDLYVFDETQAWAASLTHEWLDDGGRYCLWSSSAEAPGAVGAGGRAAEDEFVSSKLRVQLQ